jgi:selenocysteine lyase/cysteine desulfurase
MLSTTGRKFLRGPRGTGFLYVRRSALDRLEPVMLDHFAAEWVAPDRFEIRPDARRFENWEASYALRVGLGAAIDYALGWGLDAIWERASGLAADLRERLSEIPGVRVHDVGERKGAIVTFTVEGVPADEVKAALVARGVNVSSLDAFSARLDFEDRALPPLVRASVHYFNTGDELDRLIREVRAIRG